MTFLHRHIAPLFGPRHLPTMTAALILIVLYLFGAFRHTGFEVGGILTNLLANYAYVGIAAVGMTFVILAGGIDLSVGSVVAFTSILTAKLVAAGMHPALALPIAVAIGAAFGSLMGGLIHRFALPAFMVTLAGMFAMRAAGFLIHEQNLPINHPFYTWVDRSASPEFAGLKLYFQSSIFLAVLALGTLALTRTPFGANVYALGGNERAARAMGVPTAATRVGVYALSGALAALAGWTFTLFTRSGDPAAVKGMELDVIASVVIGGTLLSGGVGSLAGTFIGVLILGIIRALIDFEGTLNAAWTGIATGILLLGCIGIQRFLTRK